LSIAAPFEVDTALASLLGFWADAGVDTAYADGPVDRLEAGRRRLDASVRSPVPAGAGAPDTPAVVISGLGGGLSATSAASIARDLASSAATLDELSTTIEAFELCPLKTMGARQSVFARGRPDAQVMLIGEGPGAEEDLQGLPFVGKAGKLLDRMLAAAGLADEVFITNTVFWRPPGNRTPTPDEQAICAPFVERAIELVNPAMLVLVGGAAAKSMLGRPEGILSLRGRWTEWTGGDGQRRPVLPTLHPAFLLRQPVAKKQAWADLLAVSARLADAQAGRDA
jgi:uracil-DNA glycosylase